NSLAACRATTVERGQVLAAPGTITPHTLFESEVYVLTALAPRVAVYAHGTAPPAVREGWIALAQLPPALGSPAVFGDGSHPTTRLCAAAVDLLSRQRHPEAVLDVGTGTGILARIARARGASFVVATDIDPDALSC